MIRRLPIVFMLAAATFAAAFVSCRSSLRGAPLAPLRAATPEQALDQLRDRLAAFEGIRALMRVRVTSGGKTQSFRGQLVVPDRDSMELIAYTPVGTVAATIRAKGDRIEFEPEDLARSLSIYSPAIKPSELALLLVGLPAVADAIYVPTTVGLASASAADVTVTFDPTHFPPKRVVVRRGADVVEIEHLDIVAAAP